jgi:hypothetical protein
MKMKPPVVVTSSHTRFEVQHQGRVFNVDITVTGPSVPYGMADHLINVVSQNFDTLDGTPPPVVRAEAHKTTGETWGEEDTPEEATVEEETVAGQADEDIYASFTKLKDLVLYLHSQGYTEFQSIFAACTELVQGDLCPMLTKVSNLEARLKTTCTANGIPV